MPTAGSRILVTGGSGLVGNAVRWASSRHDLAFGSLEGETWIYLSSADGDLRNYEQAKQLFEKHRPDHVVHLAAHVGGVYANSLMPADFLRDNLAIDQNVLRLCKDFQVKKMVSCLSTCIFPDETTYPIDESMLHNGPPHDSNFGYAYAKRMLDVSNRAYHAQYGCNFTSVIPTNIFGPDDNFGEGCHFVPSIIKRVIQAKDEGISKIAVPGRGKALRQFIYSRDLGRLMIWTLRHHHTPEPLILSVDPEDEVSIYDVVHMVCRLSDYRGTVEWETDKTDGQLKKTACNRRLKQMVGNLDFTPLEQALSETLAWYDSNKDTIRNPPMQEESVALPTTTTSTVRARM